MDYITIILDFILHLNQHLGELVNNFGLWTYAILFLIIFCETGLVIAPFLPGDSLLFATGTVAAISDLNIHIIVPLLILAAVIGDNCNYWIGHFFGEKLFTKDSRWLKPSHLQKTHNFFEKYGCKTIIIARFVPIVRTMTPFVAGMGSMPYKTFMLYSIIAAIIWVTVLAYVGYFFGNLIFVKSNFSIVIMVIIIISVLPAIIEFIRTKYFKREKKASR